MEPKNPCKTIPQIECTKDKFCNAFGCSRNKSLNQSFETSPIGSAFVGKDGKFLISNQAYADILGYSLDEMKSLTYMDVTHEDDLKTDEDQAIAVAQGKISSYNMQKRYIKKDGSISWVHLYVSGAFNEEGEFLYYVVHGIDINHLKEQEKLTRFASEAGEVGMWVWNVSRDELSWNKEMYKIFEVEEGSKVTYDTWADSLHPEDKENAEKVLKKALREGRKFDMYFRILVNGKTKHIRARAREIGVAPNLILTGSNVDVTDFKETRDELEKNNEELEYFTYSVSHDLKSPLVTLSGFASLIEHCLIEDVVDLNLIKDASGEISKATQHLSSTIDSILHLSRIGRIYIEKTHINTEDIINDIMELNDC